MGTRARAVPTSRTPRPAPRAPELAARSAAAWASPAAGERAAANPCRASRRLAGPGTSLACVSVGCEICQEFDAGFWSSRSRPPAPRPAPRICPAWIRPAWRRPAWRRPAPTPPERELEDLRRLEALAQKEAALHLPPLSDRQRLIAGPIEAHMRLQRCDRPITPVVSGGAHMRDRVLVELRCPGSPAWHIYVSVRMVGTSPVAIAARAIVAGSVLTEKDVRIEQRDIPELPPGYLDDPTVAIGTDRCAADLERRRHHESISVGRESGATRPNRDPHRRFRVHEHPHGRQSAQRCPHQSTG